MRRWVLLLFGLVASTATAEVVRIEVETRGDIAEGKSYGLAGPYERLAGRIHFEVDPQKDANRVIRDIQYAPTNAAGKVEFSSDFYLIKPKDIEAGNGAVLLDVLNRGNKVLLQLSFASRSSEPSTDAEMGDGFLLRRGFSLLWVGWQFDTLAEDGRMRLYAPIATDKGEPIEGLVRSDFVVGERVFHHSLGHRGHQAYPVRDPEDARNVMTVRDEPTAERQVVPRDQWEFARQEEGRAVPDPTMVYLHGGFEPGRIYEVVYVSQDPPIAGTGPAAIRDTISLLKYGSAEALSIPAGAIDRSIAFGSSQSGRFLRTFLHDGFNGDERGKKVFDGVIPHIAGARRGSINHRFAQPSRASGGFFYPLGLFPFADAAQTDPATGKHDGLLAGVTPGTMPRVFHTNTSTEYWRASCALTHTTADGTRDLAPVETARIYHFAGTQHGPAPFPPAGANSGHLRNPNNYAWFLRSLLVSMDRWLTEGTPPPASRYPTIAKGTLVRLEELQFPQILDVSGPAEVSRVRVLDHGPRFASEGIITREPPGVGAAYPFLVPAVDESGNEIAGLRSPALAAPLGTYTGWYPASPESGRGLFLPFARTEAERKANGDPRPSLAQRYTSREHYLGVVAGEALALIDQGYLLGEDLPDILQSAGRRWDYLMAGSTQ